MNKYVKGSLIFIGGLASGMFVQKARVVHYLNSNKTEETKLKYDEVIFGSWHDADVALKSLKEICDVYGYVTVCDLYEIAGLPVDHVNIYYGWNTLKGVEVKPVRDGYVLDLPAPSNKIR